MFTTKKDVDRHVRTSFSKLNGENETNLRGYTVAKLYFKIGEYSSAQHHVSLYLSVKEDSAPAHKLLGQCYEKLNKPEKALNSYQRSLQLDTKQSDLIIEVCKILLSNELNINSNKVKYWCDLAESERIQHDAVFNLKLKLLTKDKMETKQIDELILNEIIARPTVPGIRIRLIKHFVEQKKVLDAFKYGFDIEMKNNEIFSNSIDWYNTLGLVLNQYKQGQEKTHPKNWDYWLLSLITIERQVYLTLLADSALNYPQNNNLNEANNLLFDLDQTLEAASHVLFNVCPERELVNVLLKHYRAQFCLHAASLLFKREKLFNKNQWRETTKNCLPLLLLSFHSGTPDAQDSWLKHTAEATRQLVELWKRQGAFRCSQAGRTLLSCIDDVKENLILATIRTLCPDKGLWSSEDEILTQIRQTCSDASWRKSLFRVLYSNSDQVAKMSTSHLVSNKSLNDIVYELPTQSDLETYEEVAQWLYPSSLQHLVYLGLGISNLSDLRCIPFAGLNFSSQNLTNCSAGTLSQLDMEAFLSSTILQAKRSLELEKYHYEAYNSKVFDKPLILPFANIARNLSTEEQSNWWNSAFKISRNIAGDDLSELRMTLQYGIEAVRGIGAPKIDLFIALKLGQIFAQRNKKCTKPAHREMLENRAETLFKSALHMMKIQSKGNLDQFRKYFKYPNHNNDIETSVNSMAEEAITFMATKYFKHSDFEECINDFSGLQLPFASYFQAEAYRKLDESNKTPKKSKKLYMEKARDCLNKTLDLLDGPGTDRNHPLRSIIHSEIKRLQFTNQFSLENVSNGFHQRDTDEDDYNNESSFIHRRRERSLSSSKTVELENMLRQMMDSLSILRDEVSEILKPEVMTIKSDIVGIQTKLNAIEEIMNKKTSLPDEETQELASLFDEEFKNHVLAEASQMNLDYPVSRQLLQQQAIVQNQQASMFPYNQISTGGGNVQVAANPFNNSIPFNTAYQMYMYPYQCPSVNIPPPTTTQRPKLPMNWMRYPDQLNLSQVSPQINDPNNSLGHTSSTPLQSLLMQKNPIINDIHQQQLSGNKLPSSSVADMLAAPSLLKSLYPYNNFPVDKSPPINVVITNSDPLPTHNTITPQPPLSVTIPIHHIKNNNVTNVINDVVNEHYSMPVEPITPTQQISKHDYNQEQDYDPRPDFQPIISLPEIEIKTGEENENTLFSAQTKLFKHINKEWKERGSGEIKILKNNIDGKIRVVMRRDQVLSICLNHFITPELKISHSKPNPKVCTWVAPEVTDGILTMDKFCARFINVEIANQFVDEFERAKMDLENIGKPQEISTAIPPKPITQIFEVPKPTISFFTPPQPQTIEPKTTTAALGGFTFLGNPIFSAPLITTSQDKIKEIDNTIQPAEDTKPNPFGSFSFSKPATTNSDKPFSNIFNLKSISQSTGIFEPKVSATVTVQEHLNRSGEIGEGDDYVPTAQFQPVIPLPDLIEVKTGEEEEEIVFEHRAKLLRFDITLKEWKERGIGNMKVLINKNDPNKVRLLMRREQIFKLCCNQVLTKDTQFKKKSDTALTWCGQDFSENELKDEVLAIRFKTADTCKQFHNIIIEAQKNITDDKVIVEPVQETIVVKEPETSFGDKFKPKAGAWTCDSCYCSNNADIVICIACSSPKDGSNIPATIVQPKELSGFGDKFKPKAGAWTCETCYISNIGNVLYCVACDSPKDNTVPKKEPKNLLDATPQNKFTFGVQPNGGGFTFGTPATTVTTNSLNTIITSTTSMGNNSTFSFGSMKPVTESPDQKFKFGSQNTFGGFSFGNQVATPSTDLQQITPFSTPNAPDSLKSLIKTPAVVPAVIPAAAVAVNNETISSTEDEKFNFERKKSFDFVFKPKSPGKIKSPLKEHHENGEESDEEAEEEENNTYFAPVIPLPEKIDVRTGEENEIVLYSHRAKLFRFIDSEWKERGLGDVKILMHSETKKLRVVMRREQVLKICLNHVLTDEVIYKPKDDKSWLFVVNDFSEGTLELMNFCLRFKTHEIAEEFKNTIANVLAKENQNTSLSGADKNVSHSKDITPSSDDNKLIEKLMLPSNFFAYKDNPDCPGCRGCQSDDFIFPELALNVNKDIADENPLPFILKYVPIKQKTPEKINRTIAVDENINNLGVNKSESGGNIFGGKGFTFGSSNIFGSSTNNTENLSTGAPFTFWNRAKETSKDSEAVSEEDNEKAEKIIFASSTPSLFGTIGTSGNILTPASLTSFSFTSAAKELEKPNTLFEGASNLSDKSIFSFASSLKKIEEADKMSTVPEVDVSSGDASNKTDVPITVFKTFGQKLENISSNPSVELSADMFKTDPGLTFASLASSTSQNTAFSNSNVPAAGFFGLSNNQDFSNFLSAKNKTEADTNNTIDSGGATGGGEDATYDPHYEPIIALPKEIVMSTGEEDEVKLFGERAKLYRFDSNTKEWKERGVGELKILHHGTHGTYRLLLRREQIHKLVLNHSITVDFAYNQMNSSGNAYCWATLNYSEEHPEGQIEKLAARFKNTDIAERFDSEVNKCLDQLKTRGDLEPEED